MNYTIKDISKLLNVSEEQVRRWCRNGQLKSLKYSRKQGYVIEKCDFFAFLDDNPKYKKALDLGSDDNALKKNIRNTFFRNTIRQDKRRNCRARKYHKST